ncbi:hypothetical protein HYH02_001648 [Chlamydomonas schloesseri]|uniref:Uncharacterized protein n=1 Tax=Chlamydomonas schloesseri TaxID=2026947 RepID=A0A836BC10_9CHLO|nr:hypothetical protein HYH02_001648 [Chlamydomonas schloesseri]|eukprot:KAG2453425.1 hypothetical protein HYH02_001648 [Chlamydomonas schloesseri]
MPGCAGASSLRLAIAYGCVIGAALASVVGALLVVFLDLSNDLYLASALAFAGGIMSYVSFVDIFANKAVSNFVEAGFSPATSYTLASVCFFGGFPISYVLDKLADELVDRYVSARARSGGDTSGDSSSSSNSGKIHICVQHASPPGAASGAPDSATGADCGPAPAGGGEGTDSAGSRQPCHLCKLAARAPADLETSTLASSVTITQTRFSASTSSLNTCPSGTTTSACAAPSSPIKSAVASSVDGPALPSACTRGLELHQEQDPSAAQVVVSEVPLDTVAVATALEAEVEKSRALVHMGFLAALAVALHNMPEGLVTFVGYMDSMGTGITTAVAITLHNIPEGMVIASSVYYGTKSLRTALMWASIAALTEPLGGLIGLAVVCGGSMSNLVFGILFGLVAGIMVYISFKELLPGARRFDPKDKVTTLMTILGMGIMSASLTAILYSEPGGGSSSGASATVTSAASNVCINATAAGAPAT